MVVTQERNQPLDSHCEPYVRHVGREGLPAVWCMGEPFNDRTPPVWDGRRDGTGVECARVGGCGCCCSYSVKNVRWTMFLECWIGIFFFKDGRLWRRFATVVEALEGAWLLVEGGWCLRLCSNAVKNVRIAMVYCSGYVEEEGEGGLACEDVELLVLAHCEHARTKNARG